MNFLSRKSFCKTKVLFEKEEIINYESPGIVVENNPPSGVSLVDTIRLGQLA